MEPPPLGDAGQTDFREIEDGEGFFVSTVTTLEVRVIRGRGLKATRGLMLIDTVLDDK